MATDVPHGTALSKRLRGRTTSASWSAPGVEEHLRLRVPEEAQRLVGEAPRLVEPAPVERGLVEREQPGGHHRVVLEVALELGLPVLPGAQQPAVRARIGRGGTRRSARPRRCSRAGRARGRPRRSARQHEAVPARPAPCRRGPDARACLARRQSFRAPGDQAGQRSASSPSSAATSAGSRGTNRMLRALEVGAAVHAPVGERRARPSRRPAAPRGSRPASRRRTCPPRLRCRRPGPSRSRRPGCGHLAQDVVERLLARSRRYSASPGRQPARGGRARRAGRCRRASSRSAARARRRRPSSGGSRRRAGRRCRRAPSASASARTISSARGLPVALPEAQDELPGHRLRELGRAARSRRRASSNSPESAW